MTDWSEARKALYAGKVVWIPGVTNSKVGSIFAGDRRRGVRLAIRGAIRDGVKGMVVWKKN